MSERPASGAFRANPLVELIKTRLREFVREKGLLFWVFGFPILMAMGLGLAFREKPADPPRIAVIGSESNPSVRALLASKELIAEPRSADEAKRALSDRKSVV